MQRVKSANSTTAQLTEQQTGVVSLQPKISQTKSHKIISFHGDQLPSLFYYLLEWPKDKQTSSRCKYNWCYIVMILMFITNTIIIWINALAGFISLIVSRRWVYVDCSCVFSYNTLGINWNKILTANYMKHVLSIQSSLTGEVSEQ